MKNLETKGLAPLVAIQIVSWLFVYEVFNITTDYVLWQFVALCMMTGVALLQSFTKKEAFPWPLSKNGNKGFWGFLNILGGVVGTELASLIIYTIIIVASSVNLSPAESTKIFTDRIILYPIICFVMVLIMIFFGHKINEKK